MAAARSRMTILEAYAQHGSVSYGPLSADRLLGILQGDEPEPSEKPRVQQALEEMPGAMAHDLAAEIGMSHASLNARTLELLGRGLPE